MSDAPPGTETKRFGRSAGLLSAGVGTAGILTYLYFAIASHNLSAQQYGEIVVLWSAVFLTISIAYRPVEQLLSRTIAERRAQGAEIGSALRVAGAIQAGIAALLAALMLLFREPLEDDLLSGQEALYWVLFVAIVAFAISVYARGFLAGNRRFVLLASVYVCEAGSRALFALAVALGITSGQAGVAIGIAAAPIFSVVFVPLALLGRTDPEPVTASGDSSALSLAAGGGFAAAVFVIMLSEQTLLNAGPLLARGFVDAATAGFVFNVLMLARAPLVVFQGVATTLLPHLTRLRSREGSDEREFRASVRVTLIAVAIFTPCVLLVVLVAGPELMQIAFGDRFEYDRLGLAIVTVGMGLYLASTTLNQAALARGLARRASFSWAGCGAGFLIWCLLPIVADEPLRIEIGFTAAAAALCLLLARIHAGPAGVALRPGSPEEIEATIAAAEDAG